MRKIVKSILSLVCPFYSGWQNFMNSTILPNAFWEYALFRLGIRKVYWPKDKTCLVANPRKIYVGKNCKIGRPGTYIQGAGKVYIGDYVRFGPNVGILSSNHDFYKRDCYNVRPIIIGEYSWIGMGAMILAGVELGPSTIVGAGSVVTKSFPNGFCVIAGNPAKVVKYLDVNKVQKPNYIGYYGYIPEMEFEKMRSKYIDI